MEYDSAIRMNKVLIYAKAQMKLENVMLSERSQSHKNYIAYNVNDMKCLG